MTHDEFQTLRDLIATQATSTDPSQRAGSRLMNGALDSVIEFKRLVEADPDSDEAAEIAIGLVDAIAMVMASLLTHCQHLAAVALADRLGKSISHVIRSRATKGKEDNGPKAGVDQFRGSDTTIRGPVRPRRRTRARNVSH
jgi:hypothetical protein